MSLNYYIALPGTTEDHWTHVGLSAGGLFRFRAHPAQGLVSFDAWAELLKQTPKRLFDEYDAPVAVGEFLEWVTRERDEVMNGPRKGEYHNAPLLTEGQTLIPGKRWRDAQGFLFHDFDFS